MNDNSNNIINDNSNNNLSIQIPPSSFGDIFDDIHNNNDDTDPFPPPMGLLDISGLNISGQGITHSTDTTPNIHNLQEVQQNTAVAFNIDNSNNNISDTDDDSHDSNIQSHNNNSLCCVCYNRHSHANMVHTPCKHNICNQCFFRWIKINPNCPICRNNFTSWHNMSNDDINEELFAITHLFETVSNQHNKLLKKNDKLKQSNVNYLHQNQTLLNKNKKLFQSNIRLNQQIEYSKGYYHSLIDGYKSHIISSFYNNNPFLVKLFVDNDIANLAHTDKVGYQNGYNCGYKDFNKYLKSSKKKFKTISSQTSLINTDDDSNDSNDEWSSLNTSSSSNDNNT